MPDILGELRHQMIKDALVTLIFAGAIITRPLMNHLVTAQLKAVDELLKRKAPMVAS
jgi:hypothetical protein